jgi:hypothetical protein
MIRPPRPVKTPLRETDAPTDQDRPSQTASGWACLPHLHHAPSGNSSDSTGRLSEGRTDTAIDKLAAVNNGTSNKFLYHSTVFIHESQT